MAVQLLEPDAPDSLLHWGYLDAIFEQKEYAEEYVMEPMAREMMARDPKLREEFQTKLETDPAFAASAAARLEFFYRRTPFFDERLNVYPSGGFSSGWRRRDYSQRIYPTVAMIPSRNASTIRASSSSVVQ